MKNTYEPLEGTERVLFDTMKRVQRDRMEHQKARMYSSGEKERRHRLRAADCMSKEQVLEEVLTKAGLFDMYRDWSGLYDTKKEDN